MLPFTEDVIEIISSIPQGKVATYGQIAKMAGSPKAARQVVRVLHSMTRKYDLPWHRVINSKGKIAIRDPESTDLQRAKLVEDGVTVVNYSIDLDVFGWDGEF
ncbi:MAG: MGMT family protein [Candidatus Kariarchaeaceae archaeon]|jgi:methylated-DNA-protein-cysteine methyltransferase-like protein